MTRVARAPRLPAKGEVFIPQGDADLVRRVAAALAGQDEQAQRLRRVLDAVALTQEAKPARLQEWLATLADKKE